MCSFPSRERLGGRNEVVAAKFLFSFRNLIDGEINDLLLTGPAWKHPTLNIENDFRPPRYFLTAIPVTSNLPSRSNLLVPIKARAGNLP
jgi:hypothetical protein